MPAKLRPQKFRLEGCGKLCSLNPEKFPGQLGQTIHEFYEAGDNDQTIVEKARLLGAKVSNGAVGRHRANHLIPELTRIDKLLISKGQMPESNTRPNEPAPKVDDLTVLEQIISKGAQGIDLSTVRISPEMTIRAIELKYKLTQGSAFEGFLAAIGGTMDEVTGRGHEPEVASEEENAQGAADAVEPAE